jgi:hypothetical protein
MTAQVDDVVDLIRMEYAEMPGLSLTAWQIQRLWDLSDELCRHALASLTRRGFLVQTRDGAYVRPTGPRTGSQLRSLPAA